MSVWEERREEPRSSVKLTVNAKGDVQPEVKVYAGDLPVDVQLARKLAQDALAETLSWLEERGLRTKKAAA